MNSFKITYDDGISELLEINLDIHAVSAMFYGQFVDHGTGDKYELAECIAVEQI